MRGGCHRGSRSLPCPALRSLRDSESVVCHSHGFWQDRRRIPRPVQALHVLAVHALVAHAERSRPVLDAAAIAATQSLCFRFRPTWPKRA